MSPGRKCIVCGKPVTKRTTTYFHREPEEARPAKELGAWGGAIPAREAKPEGHVEGSSALRYFYTSTPPRTVEDCRRWTNHAVVSVRRRKNGDIYRFGTWDGESYASPYFHSDGCARDQGYASAQHGARFTWRKP